MTATNHALTGALIGLSVGNPWIAAPAALLSHFVCDALPHFGHGKETKHIKTKAFRNYLVADASLCTILVIILAITQPRHWLLAAACAFLAASPDFLWIRKFRSVRYHTKWQPTWLDKFAADIQWFQRPIGAVVEAVWFVGATLLLVQFLH
ncbi:MAG TPA: hypothetical protein VG604_04670 [Candidatus Saccharimonadales bacterium]|nr:hypothetical protein [Candidatus Saccharimonadales bacterium]